MNVQHLTKCKKSFSSCQVICLNNGSNTLAVSRCMGRPLKLCPSDPAGMVGHEITMFYCVCECVLLCVCVNAYVFVLCTWQLMVHAVDRNYLVPLWLHRCKNPWALWDTASSGSAPDKLAHTHTPTTVSRSTHAHTQTHTHTRLKTRTYHILTEHVTLILSTL